MKKRVLFALSFCFLLLGVFAFSGTGKAVLEETGLVEVKAKADDEERLGEPDESVHLLKAKSDDEERLGEPDESVHLLTVFFE